MMMMATAARAPITIPTMAPLLRPGLEEVVEGSVASLAADVELTTNVEVDDVPKVVLGGVLEINVLTTVEELPLVVLLAEIELELRLDALLLEGVDIWLVVFGYKSWVTPFWTKYG